MKRLTDKRLALPPGVWQEVTREQRMELQEIPVPSKQELYYRLFEIEEILCDSVGDNDPDAEDEYDLDRLAVMCNQRMSMRDEVSERFSLTKDIPLDRLRELVEADREGRCVVLPFKPPKWVYMCSKRFPEPAQAYYASAVNVLSEMEKGCVFGDTPEEADDALKAREQDD